MAGLFDGSLICARAAFAIKPSLPSIESHIESLKNAIVSRWHFAMLNDEGAFLSLVTRKCIRFFIPNSSSELSISACASASRILLGP